MIKKTYPEARFFNLTEHELLFKEECAKALFSICAKVVQTNNNPVAILNQWGPAILKRYSLHLDRVMFSPGYLTHKQDTFGFLQHLSTVAVHPPVLVGRTSKMDCDKMWGM